MPHLDLDDYDTLIFDCDGVLLNSNKVKTDAFYRAALPFGEEAARNLVDYHVSNGGVSRYRKFEYYIEHIVPKYSGLYCPDINSLLDVYAFHVKDGLLSCDVTFGLHELRQKTPRARWMIVSGGDQLEIREVFCQRGLESLFDGGIFGSPESKSQILSKEYLNIDFRKSVFFGDSYYDYEVSKQFLIDFVFCFEWTEARDWQVSEIFDGAKLSVRRVFDVISSSS